MEQTSKNSYYAARRQTHIGNIIFDVIIFLVLACLCLINGFMVVAEPAA